MATTLWTYQFRRDLAATWTSVNPVLLSGEQGWETDTDKFKFGDGVTAWNSLPYVNSTTGTVTSVGLSLPVSVFSITGSPVTTSGTLTGAFVNQSVNTVFAGPSSGGAAAPTFRALVSSDLPAGTGTVTSVGFTAPADFTVTGSPVTSSGTLSLGYASHAQNLVFASPNGSSGVPTFRSLVAADLPAGTGTVTSVGLSLPADFTVTGSPVTGSGTLTATYTSQTANKFLASPNGSSGAPTFRTIVPADVPVMVASGASHAAGLAPDPGSTAGTTKFLREDATWAVPAGGGSSGPFAATTVINGFYSPMDPFAAGSLTTNTYSSNTLRMWPVFVHRPLTLSPILYVTGGANATNMVTGLYSQGTDGLPNTLLNQFTTLTMAATGVQTSSTYAVVTPGTYWIAELTNGTTATLVNWARAGVGQVSGMEALLGFSSTVLSTFSPLHGALTSTLTFTTTLPSSLSGTTWTENAVGNPVFYSITSQM